MRWIQTVNNPFPVGNHTICVSSGGKCVDITITNPNISANVIDTSFTGSGSPSILSTIIQQPDGKYMVG